MNGTTTLVIGATGILAPAATQLRRQGQVIGVARRAVHRQTPDGQADLAVNARDHVALARSLHDLSWDDAVVYAPTMSADSLRYVRERTPGRVVLVCTTEWADPQGGYEMPPQHSVGEGALLILQLGWREDLAAARSAGESVWHSETEISEAALQVLESGQASVLGVIRPWSDRP